MILLEVRTALRRANKYDLFTGDLENMHAKQALKDNVTVFALHEKTKALSGPKTIFSYHDFVDVYHKMAFGLLGVITPIPNVVTVEFLFDLVLREATIDDLKDTPRHIKLNRMFYTYASNKLLGPFYIDNSTTSLYLENLVAKKQIFVPHERQHFQNRSVKKTG